MKKEITEQERQKLWKEMEDDLAFCLDHYFLWRIKTFFITIFNYFK